MSLWVSFKLLSELYGLINLFVRNLFLFGQSVSKNHTGVAVKEITNSVIDFLKPDPKFMNAVSQGIGIRPMKFMSEIPQSLDPLVAFDSRLPLNPVELVHHRNCTIILSVVYDLDSRH